MPLSIPDAQAATPGHFTGIGILMTCQYPQEAGFATTVSPHQTNLLALTDRKRDRFQQPLMAKGQGEFVKRPVLLLLPLGET